MPNLDDDNPDPILEDYLQIDEQLRIYPNNFTLPRLMRESFNSPDRTTCKLQRFFSKQWLNHNTDKI